MKNSDLSNAIGNVNLKYIEEMENCTSREKMFVSNWDNKLKTLKHLKWLRNQIAHPNDSYEVTPQDLTDIKAFYDELMTQQDPLALLYKEIENTKKKQQEYSKFGRCGFCFA